MLCAASAVDGVDGPEPNSSCSEFPPSRSELPRRPLSPSLSPSRCAGRPCLRSCCDGPRASSCSWSSVTAPSADACRASAVASSRTSWSSLAASQLWAGVRRPGRRRHRWMRMHASTCSRVPITSWSSCTSGAERHRGPPTPLAGVGASLPPLPACRCRHCCNWMAARTCSLVPMMPLRSSTSGADLHRPCDFEPPVGGDMLEAVRLGAGDERCAGVPSPPLRPSSTERSAGVPVPPARSRLRRVRRNMVMSYWVISSTPEPAPRGATLGRLHRSLAQTQVWLEGCKEVDTFNRKHVATVSLYTRCGAQYCASTGTAAQPNILAAKALSLALASASASLHAVKASRISFDFGSSLLAASRSALAAA